MSWNWRVNVKPDGDFEADDKKLVRRSNYCANILRRAADSE
jgi:hypothetical protein